MEKLESREDEHTRLQRTFNKIDVNKDGKITVEELHLMMNKSYSSSDPEVVSYVIDKP